MVDAYLEMILLYRVIKAKKEVTVAAYKSTMNKIGC